MDRIYYQIVAVPANTPQSAPFTVTIPLEENDLVEIDCIIPDGHCGLTGIRLLQSQQQVWPWANNSYFVGNDTHLNIPYKDAIQASGMVAEGFNTDIFAHGFYFRFTVTNTPIQGEESPAEVTTATDASGAYYPEDDDLDVNNIIDDTSDSGTDDTGTEPPVTAPAATETFTGPTSTNTNTPRVGKPIRVKAGVK